MGILQRGQCVNIHYAINAVIVLLEGNVILNGAEIITYVLSAGRSGAGENALIHIS
jgi:hypothetical protein